MKRLPLCMLLFATLAIGSPLPAGEGTPAGERIRISFTGGEVVVALHPTPAGRDFVTRLPLTVTFKDYIGKEKIAYLSDALETGDTNAALSGDFAYYKPWGNLAVFYDGVAVAGNGLFILGVIESGKGALAAKGSDFHATIERIR